MASAFFSVRLAFRPNSQRRLIVRLALPKSPFFPQYPLLPRKRTNRRIAVLTGTGVKQPRSLEPSWGRRPGMSGEDVVHHVENAYPELSRHRREPRRSVQGVAGVRESLLPSRLHGWTAELEVL